MQPLHYRRGTPSDLDALLRLERDFPGDRLSRRSFRRLLASESAEVWVGAAGANVLGNAVVLYRRKARSARLYSIIVAAEARGRGIAVELLRVVEAAARRRGCERLRLEVRVDNETAITLYQKGGYRVVQSMARFYDDGQDALRFERVLTARQHLAA